MEDLNFTFLLCLDFDVGKQQEFKTPVNAKENQNIFNKECYPNIGQAVY